VIFDSPPILAVTDAAVLSRVVDGTNMVVRAGRTTRDAVNRSKRAMAKVNPNIIGVVLNDVNLKNPHYASYYQYYQYQSHEQNVADAATKST
jgi:Mrp family chromosome partitioning ATPase